MHNKFIWTPRTPSSEYLHISWGDVSCFSFLKSCARILAVPFFSKEFNARDQGLSGNCCLLISKFALAGRGAEGQALVSTLWSVDVFFLCFLNIALKSFPRQRTFFWVFRTWFKNLCFLKACIMERHCICVSPSTWLTWHSLQTWLKNWWRLDGWTNIHCIHMRLLVEIHVMLQICHKWTSPQLQDCRMIPLQHNVLVMHYHQLMEQKLITTVAPECDIGHDRIWSYKTRMTSERCSKKLI